MTAETGRVIRAAEWAPEAQASCFLCAFSPQPCEVASAEGRIAAIWERSGAGRDPAVLLMGDDGSTTYVTLNAQARSLVRALLPLEPARWHDLHLRVFHLERTPTRPTADLQENGGQSVGDATEPREGPPEAEHFRRQRLRATPLSVAVLEPDLLLNITDINNAEYCVRQYPLRRLVPSPPTPATLRGKVVHRAFEELLKSGSLDVAGHLRRALDAQLTDLALRQISYAQAASDAEPHLRALAAWYSGQRQTLWGDAPALRAETFLLAPEIGLRGRLDFLLHDEHGDALLELKTGEVRVQLPRREHRWQVYGYQTLLAARRPAHRRPGATLLYSGTPGQAEAYGIPFTLRDLHRVVELRNALALIHATGAAPRPPGGATCGRCMLRRVCVRASSLLGWEPPPTEEPDEAFDPEDVAAFAEHYELLRLEARAAEIDARQLWRLSPEQRREMGRALGDLHPLGEPRLTESGEWEYTFACEQTSELRENDSILLSDGDAVRGAAVTGTILRLEHDRVTVWTREPLAHPALIDRYESEMVHDRTVRNLWRWLEADPHLRALVNGTLAPSFDDTRAPGPAASDTLNPEQRQAVERALAARDFLLIQGPPGTGKTSVVAEIARRAVARGERVLLAGFTNQAVDNVLRRILADGMRDFVRLGHELSVAEELRPFRLSARPHPLPPPPQWEGRYGEDSVEESIEESIRVWDGISSPHVGAGGQPAESGVRAERVVWLRETLGRAPLVASTAATWASETYDEVGDVLRFDLALVDEATQLTVPALLGILRFAHRFVLVGDDRQLPPLVRSEEAAARGLQRPLFSRLLDWWENEASVTLVRQYRMHPVICDFASTAFYDGRLVAAGLARTALLDLQLAPDDPYTAVLDPTHPMLLVDVPASEAEPEGKASQLQAEVTRRVVLALRRAGVPAREIGVIAPYRAHVALIRQRLAASGEMDVSVDTVDRFQGAERAVVVFSFGGSAAQTHRADFLADPRRLNVALTRAQRKLILIGNRRRMEAFPLLRRLVSYCRALYNGRGGIVTALR